MAFRRHFAVFESCNSAIFTTASLSPVIVLQKWSMLSNRLKPDLVALTGDFVTYSRASIEPVAEILGGLRARTGRGRGAWAITIFAWARR